MKITRLRPYVSSSGPLQVNSTTNESIYLVADSTTGQVLSVETENRNPRAFPNNVKKVDVKDYFKWVDENSLGFKALETERNLIGYWTKDGRYVRPNLKDRADVIEGLGS